MGEKTNRTEHRFYAEIDWISQYGTKNMKTSNVIT